MCLRRNITEMVLLEPVVDNNQGKNEQTNAHKTAKITKYFLLHIIINQFIILFCRRPVHLSNSFTHPPFQKTTCAACG
jgi:hypothetical protein